MERKALRRRAFLLQNPAEMATTGITWTPYDGNQGGEVYKSEGQSPFSMLRNSPPRSHVPHSGTPIRVSQASYRQVRGRGGGFETGSKKRNGQKVKVEK